MDTASPHPSNPFGPAADMLATLLGQVDRLTTELRELKGELADLRDSSGWMTVEQAADHSARSVHQIYRLLHDADRNGLFRREVVSKANGRWRIHRGRFDRWLATQRD